NSSLCNLCVLCVSVVTESIATTTTETQRTQRTHRENPKSLLTRSSNHVPWKERSRTHQRQAQHGAFLRGDPTGRVGAADTYLPVVRVWLHQHASTQRSGGPGSHGGCARALARIECGKGRTARDQESRRADGRQLKGHEDRIHLAHRPGNHLRRAR